MSFLRNFITVVLRCFRAIYAALQVVHSLQAALDHVPVLIETGEFLCFFNYLLLAPLYLSWCGGGFRNCPMGDRFRVS